MYQHECKSCGEIVDVLRSVDEYLRPPEVPCPKCGGTEWVKRVNASINRWRFLDDGKITFDLVLLLWFAVLLAMALVEMVRA